MHILSVIYCVYYRALKTLHHKLNLHQTCKDPLQSLFSVSVLEVVTNQLFLKICEIVNQTQKGGKSEQLKCHTLLDVAVFQSRQEMSLSLECGKQSMEFLQMLYFNYFLFIRSCKLCWKLAVKIMESLNTWWEMCTTRTFSLCALPSLLFLPQFVLLTISSSLFCFALSALSVLTMENSSFISKFIMFFCYCTLRKLRLIHNICNWSIHIGCASSLGVKAPVTNIICLLKMSISNVFHENMYSNMICFHLKLICIFMLSTVTCHNAMNLKGHNVAQMLSSKIIIFLTVFTMAQY